MDGRQEPARSAKPSRGRFKNCTIRGTQSDRSPGKWGYHQGRYRRISNPPDTAGLAARGPIGWMSALALIASAVPPGTDLPGGAGERSDEVETYASAGLVVEENEPQ